MTGALKPKAPTPDPDVLRRQREQEAAAEAEKASTLKEESDLKRALLQGRRGRRSLMTGIGDADTLGG